MKEITAIIRRDKLPETKKALEDLGYPSLTIQSVDGRGKQKGAMCAEMDSEMPDSFCTAVKLKPTPSTYALDHTLPKVALYVPKRLLTIVVPDDVVTTVVKVHHQGQPVGQGRRRQDLRFRLSRVRCGSGRESRTGKR